MSMRNRTTQKSAFPTQMQFCQDADERNLHRRRAQERKQVQDEAYSRGGTCYEKAITWDPATGEITGLGMDPITGEMNPPPWKLAKEEIHKPNFFSQQLEIVCSV